MNTTEQSGKEEYALWAALTGLIKPKKILEIGTSSGQGTFTIARNAPEHASIVTVDIVDHRAEAIKEHQARDIHINFIQEYSHTVLNNFLKNNERFDLIIIDGGHFYSTVKKDWTYAKKLADTIILHDAIQFNGVRKVINEIRRDPEWDVSVLSYPGATLYDNLTGKEFYSNRCPGIAIATKRATTLERSFKTFPEHPTQNSRRALRRRKKMFLGWHSKFNREQDLSFADWEMIFHSLWNYKTDAIIHLGHIGTGATLLFMEFAKSHKIPFLGIDPSGKFWPQKKTMLPAELANPNSASVFHGLHHLEKSLSFIRDHQKVFLWIDELHDGTLYEGPLQQIFSLLPTGSLACVRNFSPHNGSPNRVVVAGAECTNPRAFEFCDWLKSQLYSIRLASPEATFNDYVNAGHWLMITPV